MLSGGGRGAPRPGRVRARCQASQSRRAGRHALQRRRECRRRATTSGGVGDGEDGDAGGHGRRATCASRSAWVTRTLARAVAQDVARPRRP